ncbi:hypothetical protein ACFX2J_012983 [Malus domestica]
MKHNRGNRGNNYNNCDHTYTNHGNRGSNYNSRGNHSNHCGNSYGSRPFNPSSYRVQCQIYGSTSHEAIDCYDCMNLEIVGKVPSAKLVAMCAHHSVKPSTPSWLIDFGATAHITNDISNIQSPNPYHGEDKVYIGDGKGLSIDHIGLSLLHTPHSTFKLHNVLHVPQMQHNLLSAYQFIKDNKCSLTFDIDGSYVKVRTTGMMLLQGPVKDGFFPLQSSSTSC